ncbi:MAG: hypothetical protein ABI405_09365 [Parafilimonas sp.]
MSKISDSPVNKRSETKTILLIGIIAGTLDILTAFIIYSQILHLATPIQMLSNIARAAVSKSLIENEKILALIGLLFHYIIAYCFATFYFLIYPRIKFLRKNSIVSGLLYGIFVWAVMNLIVQPLTGSKIGPFTFIPLLRTVIILIVCIGLPIAILTARYYKKIDR